MYATFHKLYNLRIEGDYRETVIGKESLKDAIERAEVSINGLKKYNKGENYEKKTEATD